MLPSVHRPMQILKVRFRTNSEFEANYQSDLATGGLFCPTTAPLDRGEAVIVELSAPALPNKVLIRGTVKSWRPALPRLRVRAGAVVEFDQAESDKRDFVVETISGDRTPSSRRRHTRLPVAVPVRYRTSESADFAESYLTEISVGGAMLGTPAPLPIETDVILELTPPGAVVPISISGKATYHLPNGSTGLKFLYRDAGGSRRLRELVRRLRQS
jgi:Tfp pilus assembly protein PilZ